MPDTLVIHLGPADASSSWLQLDAQGAASSLQRGPLADAGKAAAGKRVVVVVPGTDVLLMRADIPIRQHKQLLAAVPYALEDELAADIDELHFAVAVDDQDGRPVAVVSDDTMQGWQQRLGAAGIHASAILPETLLVPARSDDWTLFQLNGHAMLRTGPADGFTLDADDMALVLPALAGKHDGDGKRICLYRYGTASDLDTALGELTPATLAEGDADSGEQALLQGVANGIPINLLQGQYGPQANLRKSWQPWLPVLAILLIWAVFEFSMSWLRYNDLQAAGSQYQDNIAGVYRQVFPQARNIPLGKERARVERALAAIGSGNSASAGFLELLAASGNVLRQINGARITAASFRDHSLTLSLELTDLQMLDFAKQRLVSETGYQVDIQGATSDAGKVRTRVRITDTGGAE